ncbi:MAG: hypothetical protein V3V08_22080 [Nannocystaceae bacterium]
MTQVVLPAFALLACALIACEQGVRDSEPDTEHAIPPDDKQIGVDPECERLPHDADCGSGGCESLRARRLDTDNDCFEPEVQIGCISLGTICGEKLRALRDPAGRCWSMTSWCEPPPQGWDADAASCPVIGEPCP